MNRCATLTALGLAALGLAVLAPPATAVAGEPAGDRLAEARALLRTGKYAEAAEAFEPLAAADPAAVLGLARCLAAQGKTDQAVERLEEAADGRAALQSELALLAFQRGDYREARRRADEAIRLDADHLPARWILAELDRTAGRLKEAEDGYRWFVRYYNAHEVTSAEALRWIGLAAAQYARWNRLSGQFDFLVNDLYPDALKREPDYWPARYEAGRLFLEKYNKGDAASELRGALEINPNAAEVHVALAELAAADRDLEKVEQSLDRALEINPRLLSAWWGRADLAWANFQVEATLDLLQTKALPLNPVDEETLGRIAACYLLLDGSSPDARPTRFDELVAEVTARNPAAGDFFFTLASELEARNKQPEAERYFLKAIEMMPRLVGPRAELGMLYMRTAQEDDARRLLREAFRIDPFNVRVKNMLGVLDVLAAMDTAEAGRCVLRYDATRDRLLARYAARHLEKVYPALCRQFGYEPPDRSLFEVFSGARGASGHQWFGTRMTGLPYLGTVAASTGRMVAMVSPSERPFNWARVLTHETVHVITLQQTHFNCPHWYTEGLAVHAENCPRLPEWNGLLRERLEQDDLFDLDTINFGFTRPDDSGDWHLAYCQAELYVDYMLSLGGDESLRELLAAYADGMSTPDAIQRVVGVSKDEFEAGYLRFVKGQVASMLRLKWASAGDIEGLTAARQERPDDPDAAAELAFAYLKRGADPEAAEAAEAALKLRPKHQLAAYVVARLRIKGGKTGEAEELLEASVDRQSPQPDALELLAELKLRQEKYAEAAELLKLGERLDQQQTSWTKALARTYLLSEQEGPLREALARLAEADSDDLPVRKKLAQMAVDRKDYQAAADWANQAIEISVMDGDAHRILAASRAELRAYPEAVEEYETAVELLPDESYLRFALADACVEAGQKAKARQVLKALLEKVPDYPGADLLLEQLGEE